MNTKSYARRMIEEHPEVELDIYTYPRIQYILNHCPEEDYFHDYIHFMYTNTTHKELNLLCKYLRIKGKQNKCKGEKITCITEKITNNQMNTDLLKHFEHLYCAYYITGKSMDCFYNFMTDFKGFENAFAERYPHDWEA